MAALPGGVAVIVQMDIPLRGTVLPKAKAVDPLMHHVYHSAQWLHVQMAVGEGGAMIHVHAVYGIVETPNLKAPLMEKVLEHSSRVGNAPRIIRGDFNAPLGDLLKVPQSLAMAISPRLVDLDLELAEAKAHPCLCQFQGPVGSQPSRTDGCLANVRTASLAGGHGLCPVTVS